MNLGSIPYCYEGIMRPTCSKCHTTHELTFSGSEECSIETAIEESLTAEGWRTGRMICTACVDTGEYDSITDAIMDEIDDDDDLDEDFRDDDDEEDDYDPLNPFADDDDE